MAKTILVTGCAGFIGARLVQKLLNEDVKIVGIDNLNNYYDVDLKKSRINEIIKIDKVLNRKSWIFYEMSIENHLKLKEIFLTHKPDIVVNLAAQAGVRYSLINPSAYVQSNLVGFSNILDLSKEFEIQNLIYASSSSVYVGNTNLPFDENQSVDHPVSL